MEKSPNSKTYVNKETSTVSQGSPSPASPVEPHAHPIALPPTVNNLINPNPRLTNLNKIRTTLKDEVTAGPEASLQELPSTPFVLNDMSNSRTRSDSSSNHIQLNIRDESRLMVSCRTSCKIQKFPLTVQRLTPDFEKLKSERARLETFHNSECPWPVQFVDPKDCAAAGFFFLQSGDRVQCAFCRGVAGEWERGDVPLVEHKKHFQRCPFVCNLPVGNIPIRVRENSTSSTPTSSSPEPESSEMGFDVCGPFLPPGFLNNGPVHPRHQTDSHSALRGGAQPLINAQPFNDLTQLAINTGCGPARRHLVTLPARVKTFTKEWPGESTGQSAERMSEAGFFYIGQQDHVKCFYCDGGLRNWEPQDDPWFEHARWFSKCPFVLLMKGQEYVREVELVSAPVRSDSSDEESPSSSQQSSIGSTSSDEPEDKTPTSRSGGSGSDSKLSSGEYNASGLDTGCSSDEEMCPAEQQATETVKNCIDPTAERKVELEEEIRKLKEARQCKICMDNEVGVVFLPCGHLVSCVQCATALSNCALCRQPIKAVVRTYLS